MWPRPDGGVTAGDAERWGLPALERFYGWQARLYDLTRPLLLFGRARAVTALVPTRGARVLDVGCGTGWSLPRLAAAGAEVIGVEPTAAMRTRAAARLARADLTSCVVLDARPYGSHADYAGTVAGVLCSYSLSMVPPFEHLLEAARRDLVPGGRLVVVDFLDAAPGVAALLRRSHVHLGPQRLDALRHLFPRHSLRVHTVGLWRFFLFAAER